MTAPGTVRRPWPLSAWHWLGYRWALARQWWHDRPVRRCGRTTGHRWVLRMEGDSPLLRSWHEDAYVPRHRCALCRDVEITVIRGDLARALGVK